MTEFVRKFLSLLSLRALAVECNDLANQHGRIEHGCDSQSKAVGIKVRIQAMGIINADGLVK
ncbi:hypothetical protein B0X71_06040 [Planococcus lenghuensis]|uniref:Uncharacterized protein n=1 Tax=Planococcus lenghuensis TaxID=2213202 RepID=A0A1Q2KYH5_9BACL|nr:hypothetical protein B0X71_06040 [Planococcus lenghuensis]